jgi:alpha-1,6-mannosyl-glycoprotein beta-1,2-N-acetylglucosaminyltransferase
MYDYAAISSLRDSDFPKSRVPLIVSHDGNVPDVVDYVNSLRSEFRVLQIIHPFSCFAHPTSFPGDDVSLNKGYKGDRYGNPRSGWATCCKHHFTWLLRAVFDMQFRGSSDVEHFFFLEEDYVVAPTVYTTIASGLNVMQRYGNEIKGGFFGLVLDATEAGNQIEPDWLENDTWIVDVFRTGPMTMSRSIFSTLKDHATEYCKFDDYNWDWSFVYLQGKRMLPHSVLVPSRSQVRHIGIDQGMHAKQQKQRKSFDHFNEAQKSKFRELSTRFGGTKLFGDIEVDPELHDKGFGGWGHPADHEHCITVLSGPTTSLPQTMVQLRELFSERLVSFCCGGILFLIVAGMLLSRDKKMISLSAKMWQSRFQAKKYHF